MGTKLQPAIDLLATNHFVVESEIRDSMERAFQQRSIEAVKKTMLKQEEIFKQQVMELHRLYSVQRMLMDELKNKTKEQRKHPRSTTATSSTEYSLCAQNDKDEQMWALSRSSSSAVGIDFDIVRPAAGPSSSGSVMMTPGRLSRGFAALEEDLCGDGVDLTLSIGGSKKRCVKESQPYQNVGLESSDVTKSDEKKKQKGRAFEFIGLHQSP